MKKDYQEGVDYVFEKNPELENIGTKEQYSKYLKTIFPESKVKDIVYHGSKTKTTEFKKKKGKKGSRKNVTFVTPSYSFAKSFGWHNDENVTPVLINAEKLFDYEEVNNEELNQIVELEYKRLNKEHSKEFAEKFAKDVKKDISYGKWTFFNKDYVADFLNSKKYDSWKEHEGKSENYAIFDPSQIHLLGSKQDIEKFKDFVQHNKGTSLESRIVSGIFILSFLAGLFFISPILTGNIIGIFENKSNFLGPLLIIIGIVGFFVYKKVKK